MAEGKHLSFVKAYKKAKERVERLKQLLEEEAESTTAFLNTVNDHMEKRQHDCTRAESKLQAFQKSVSQGTKQMQGKLEVCYLDQPESCSMCCWRMAP